jgi:NADH pyrophosphatase NudC (nudix superfamily)
MSCASSARAAPVAPASSTRARGSSSSTTRRDVATRVEARSRLDGRGPVSRTRRRVARASSTATRAFVPSTTYEGDDGVPFFALSDADRASELRADADAVAEAAARPDAVLLPLTGADVWVIPTDVPENDDASAPHHEHEDDRGAHRWIPAEALLRHLPPETLPRDRLSFLGFRGADGAPVFAADVRRPGAGEPDDGTGTLADAVVAAASRHPFSGAAALGIAPDAFSSAVVCRDAKSVGPEMRRGDASLLAAAAGLVRWQRSQRFCSRCGAPTRLVKAGHKAACTADGCRGAFYPILMPAVLTLCTCGDYALLGRNSKWPRGFYSCLAGFVDQSESLEQAVAREVLEESGIAIAPGSARYASSQPWPFPCQLMVGFRAEVAPRTIRVGGGAGAGSGAENGNGNGNASNENGKASNGNAFAFSYPPTPSLDIAELRDARWFHRDWLREQIGKHVDPREAKGGVAREIPVGEIALPGTHAMARRLVEQWAAEPNEDEGAGANLRSAARAVALAGGEPPPLRPPTNVSCAFAVAEFVGKGGGRATVLRFQPTGGGGAPTPNDHARLAESLAREAKKHGCATIRALGGGQLCFRGGEVSESAESDDEREACMMVVVRSGGGGDSGGAEVDAAPPELVAALMRRAYPMHDALAPGALSGETFAGRKYQY